MSQDQPERPSLVVVRGEPSAGELAALVMVLRARAAATQPAGPDRSAWNHPARAVRRPVHPASDGWRGSALPW